MQYISLDMLRDETVVAYERVKIAYKAWKASPQPDVLDNYKKMYGQYSIMYNEMMDRQTPKPGKHLPAFAQVLPPPPPGMKTSDQGGEAADAPEAAAPAVETAPAVGRDLTDAGAGAGTQTADAVVETVPAASQAADAPAVAADTASSAGGTYVVRAGDTPHSIAQQLHVDEKRLMDANNITAPGKLQIGKTLVVPE